MADASPTPGRARCRGITRALVDWFRDHARDLPWRRTDDPYRIWLSEVMLQQTRVDTVVDYYERFTRAYPTVESLAAAREQRVLKLWEGLGYYSRARNLHAAARWIVREGGGTFPRTADDLLALPGVGRYTAGAIASIAFGEPAPILDGNVKRVLARLFAIRDAIDRPATVERLWDLAARVVDRDDPGASNQALMELGALVCTPRSPRCDACPVARRCDARRRGLVDTVPVRTPRKPVPHHDIVAAVIARRGRFLFGQRPPGGLLGGLWEFPGGKVEAGESHDEALARELDEELGIRASVGPLVAAVDHAYSHFRITLHLYRVDRFDGDPEPRTHTALRWLRRADFERYAFPKATLRLLPHLAG